MPSLTVYAKPEWWLGVAGWPTSWSSTPIDTDKRNRCIFYVKQLKVHVWGGDVGGSEASPALTYELDPLARMSFFQSSVENTETASSPVMSGGAVFPGPRPRRGIIQRTVIGTMCGVKGRDTIRGATTRQRLRRRVGRRLHGRQERTQISSPTGKTTTGCSGFRCLLAVELMLTSGLITQAPLQMTTPAPIAGPSVQRTSHGQPAQARATRTLVSGKTSCDWSRPT